MTGKDVPKLEEASALHPPQGTPRINVTFLGSENLELRLEASRAVKRLGFVPVPHISASAPGLAGRVRGSSAGSEPTGPAQRLHRRRRPHPPRGPLRGLARADRDGISAAGSTASGTRRLSAATRRATRTSPGTRCASALREKNASIAEQELDGSVITQFGFDVDPVLAWLEKVRAEGITLPVRIGVPGPAGVRRLMSYATRFGVGTSASIAKKCTACPSPT
ncbi:methylenetetrahydrofolate reductase [Streptomyces sp. L7]